MYRQVEAPDLDALVTLEKTVFGPGAWTRGMLEQELNAPARTYLLYEQDGEIQAYGGFWHDGADAELMTIGVRPDCRGAGLGSGLLSRLIDQARHQSAARMLLEVRVDNEPALALYRRFGFRRLRLRKRYYQPEGIDAYAMSVDLRSPAVSGLPVGHEGAQARMGQTDKTGMGRDYE
ncbi:Ribosomal-protein-S18-alanine acetyltransferase [Bifidobacterium actinocoloniiforme DSM 22766]|uniref:Ribosomal-protein-S18-alanine acetyltransferase n=1 Tax=Bifidobacterium actinocoloniiforme DSM 22766 TaxID=1437605 RepID=A0A086Z0B2_9BIFI|nr:ribosomal protein S18-alanine N-acetyltransferase [Bifidobacterium actinocoloniiforme]KFI39962.1 Ribosomal-protein-S18-alanine acetyltransferase [Bifidobacterium actinocoloniiforme DSM 22766]